MNKSDFRNKAKKITASLPESYTEKANESIRRKVITSDEFKKSSVIFIYVNTLSEPETKSIILQALKDNKTVCVPKCVSKNRMIPVEIKSLDELHPGKYGIYEPSGDNAPYCKDSIDLAVVPCVAADCTGKRLGHGAGYYDRFLENTDIYTMCLCFRKLIFENIPTEKTDITIDRIITD